MKDWIAIVDDDISSLRTAGHILTEGGMRVSSLRSGIELLEFLKTNRPDLLLMDIHMPVMDGFETLEAIEADPELDNIPTVFLTGDEDSGTETRGLTAGAFDFIRKPFVPEILVLRVRHAIEYSRREYREENGTRPNEVHEGLKTETLTGLKGKVAVQQEIEHLCRQWQGALIVINIDNFSLIESLYGEDKARLILKDFAVCLRTAVRSTDILGHMERDEFVAYCPNTRDEEVVRKKNEYLNRELRSIMHKYLGDKFSLSPGASIGAVMAPDEGREFVTLYQKAQEAMLAVKKRGDHGFLFYWKHRHPDGRRVTGGLKVMEELYEERTASDAMVLPYEDFRLIFRLFVRMHLNRPLDSCFVVFYLGQVGKGIQNAEKPDNSAPAIGEIGDRFFEVLSVSLRSSDLVTRKEDGMFLVLLPRIGLYDGRIVVNRICKNWAETGLEGRAALKWEMDLVQ